MRKGKESEGTGSYLVFREGSVSESGEGQILEGGKWVVVLGRKKGKRYLEGPVGKQKKENKASKFLKL